MTEQEYWAAVEAIGLRPHTKNTDCIIYVDRDHHFYSIPDPAPMSPEVRIVTFGQIKLQVDPLGHH